MTEKQTLLPTDAKERKTIPLSSGVLDYFASALIEVAKVSQKRKRPTQPGNPSIGLGRSPRTTRIR